ncbi:hypothetical protein CSX02_09760 [Agathobacter ruminis]|uniref:Uncharacterized protein n=1 Tax=Agathobacter ruminis TaxID=1712665 RepID=A0A2G3E1V6_9FIRM|nr:hypothetical protein CSX02_09760 [Agathobacter ruminis]
MICLTDKFELVAMGVCLNISQEVGISLKKYMIVICVALIMILIGFGIKHHVDKNDIDFSNAERISLVYSGNINVEITDKDDIKTLKEIISGVSYRENPSCGFGYDYAVIFEYENNKTYMCIAYDGCSHARINNTNRYVRIKSRDTLNGILQKYGIPEIGPI